MYDIHWKHFTWTHYVIYRSQSSATSQLTSAQRKQIPKTVAMVPSEVPGAYWSGASADFAERQRRSQVPRAITSTVVPPGVIAPPSTDPSQQTGQFQGGASGLLQTSQLLQDPTTPYQQGPGLFATSGYSETQGVAGSLSLQPTPGIQMTAEAERQPEETTEFQVQPPPGFAKHTTSSGAILKYLQLVAENNCWTQKLLKKVQARSPMKLNVKIRNITFCKQQRNMVLRSPKVTRNQKWVWVLPAQRYLKKVAKNSTPKVWGKLNLLLIENKNFYLEMLALFLFFCATCA